MRSKWLSGTAQILAGGVDVVAMDGFMGFTTATTEELPDAVPATLTEVITLGRTLRRRANTILRYFDLPDTSNATTEAIHSKIAPPSALGHATTVAMWSRSSS